MYKLGEAYDIDLKGFTTPVLPSPSSKTWSATDLGSLAIGYTSAETPLHILTFYNAIANKGRMMKPYLVEDIEVNGIVKEKRGPSVLNGSICSRATADSLTRGLMEITETGTAATRLKNAKLKVAGKTGTARIIQDPKDAMRGDPYRDKNGLTKYQATFVGFFPAEQPKYSILRRNHTCHDMQGNRGQDLRPGHKLRRHAGKQGPDAGHDSRDPDDIQKRQSAWSQGIRTDGRDICNRK